MALLGTSVPLLADRDEMPRHAVMLSIDTGRPPRPDRPGSVHEGKGSVDLSFVMATSSNPVSPGPASPPLSLDDDQPVAGRSFIPPARPSSTPFPQHPDHHRTADVRSVSCPGGMMDIDEPVTASTALPSLLRGRPPPAPARPRLSLNQLPAEIHECILDHLFGFRVSTTSKSSLGMHHASVSLNTALRHARRRELCELALVSRVWRVLIQDRLYRHIKLKATTDSLHDAIVYFAQRPHLRPYVKHIEVWFAVFQPLYGPHTSPANTLPTVTSDGFANASYILPTDNCSLEEALYMVGTTFPEVRILTLEGGDRKKAPKVRHFICDVEPAAGLPYGCHTRDRQMPRLPSVQTLVCKGQWNLVRNEADFDTLMSAFPALRDWHASYNKPKSKSYLSMAAVLPRLPPPLTSLSLLIDDDYRREISFPPYFLKVSSQLHFCSRLADATPGLEHLAYTGRVCRSFFDLAARRANPRTTRLKSIDLTVKNCCRHVSHWNESGSGITDMNFIAAFGALVLAGVKALGRLKEVEYLRIRYVDIDSPLPPLNPYFTLHKNRCSGVWSDAIVAELGRSRPNARFDELADSFGDISYNKEGRLVINPDLPRARSLKLSCYSVLSGGISIS